MACIKVYSTGPLENQASNRSTSVFTKVLNNSKKSTKVRVLVFRLNGSKRLISSRLFTIPPKSSSFVVTDLKSNVLQFEVKIKVLGSALLGVFGKTARGNLNPSHRLVHSELTKLSKHK